MTHPTSTSAQAGATELAQRTPEQIFAHHAQALGAEDLDAIVMDYAEDACILTASGVLRGKAAIRDFFAKALEQLPQARWDVQPIFADDILFLRWTADSSRNSVPDGVDTFVFRGGLIHAQTVHFSLVPKTEQSSKEVV
jgi:hypothetical protein